MDDISRVVRNYYAVIGQKDEDIFELYKDNKRLQKQLDGVLTAEEERETDRRMLKLLVETLQTELREKQVLIEAHQAEGAALRDAVSRARHVLQMPSELDYTPDDVIDVCIGFYTESHELREQQKCLTDMALNAWSLGCYTLIEAEQRERSAIADVCECCYEAMARASHHATQVLLQRQQMDEVHEKVERERCREAELKLKRVQLECRQHERVVEDWREKLTCAENRLLFLETRLKQGQREKELLLDAACSRIDLVVEQCADAGRMLAWAFRSILLHERRLQEASREAVSLLEKTDKLETALSRARNVVWKKQQQQQQQRRRWRRSSTPDSGKDCSYSKPQSKTPFHGDGQDNENDDGDGSHHHRSKHEYDFRALQLERNALKVEWRRCVERERAVRQQASASISRLKMERCALEDSVAVWQSRCTALEDDLQRTRLEVKRQAREVRELQQSLHDEARRHAERIRSVEDANSTLEAKNTALLGRVGALQESHTAHMKELREEAQKQEEVWAAEKRAAHEHITELEQKLHDEKNRFLLELKEWTRVLEDARAKLAAAECERDRERMLRDMLQEQHREEERLLTKLALDGQTRDSEMLQGRIDTLERACRRSAEVITGLREAMHRVKTTEVSAGAGAAAAAAAAATTTTVGARNIISR